MPIRGARLIRVRWGCSGQRWLNEPSGAPDDLLSVVVLVGQNSVQDYWTKTLPKYDMRYTDRPALTCGLSGQGLAASMVTPRTGEFCGREHR